MSGLAPLCSGLRVLEGSELNANQRKSAETSGNQRYSARPESRRAQFLRKCLRMGLDLLYVYIHTHHIIRYGTGSYGPSRLNKLVKPLKISKIHHTNHINAAKTATNY